jgi:hypothetical protein
LVGACLHAYVWTICVNKYIHDAFSHEDETRYKFKNLANLNFFFEKLNRKLENKRGLWSRCTSKK